MHVFMRIFVAHAPWLALRCPTARYATQTVNVLLTGYTVINQREASAEYSTYMPSMLSVSKGKVSSGTPYMTPQSPLFPPTTNPPTSAGFQLQLVFQRNTLTVTKYVRAVSGCGVSRRIIRVWFGHMSRYVCDFERASL